MSLLAPFHGEARAVPPIWLMRQAGRYLPEYRAVRERAGGFLNLCYTPELATEVTLQPIRRFGFDAAILFSDILVVPHALGQRVWFAEGEGPRLEPIADGSDLADLKPETFHEKLAPVYEAVRRIRAALPRDTALIGFCGAPWTVATYMVAGRGGLDQKPARLWAYRDPETFGQLIDLLTEVSIDYLAAQIENGANVVQVFDSWAGVLPDDEFERWCLRPATRIVAELQRRAPGVPVILFPRGAGLAAVRYALTSGAAGIGCDTTQPLALVADSLHRAGAAPVLQGNLDPLLLVAGGDAMRRRVRQILDEMSGRPFVFNLGHGIVPETPPEHVAELVRLVRIGSVS
ncbi:MAG: uroporphyrinogen decarboxylase [Hyphomicrobiaceae bacterium]